MYKVHITECKQKRKREIEQVRKQVREGKRTSETGEFSRSGVHEMRSSEDGKFTKWVAQEMASLRIGTSANGNFTR